MIYLNGATEFFISNQIQNTAPKEGTAPPPLLWEGKGRATERIGEFGSPA